MDARTGPSQSQALADGLSYEEARAHLERHDHEPRVEMSVREDVAPEILYFLAEDAEPEVRRNIAANPKTPAQADTILVADKDGEVRCRLARKIARRLPGLNARVQSRLGDKTLELINRLIQDQLPKVRRIISEEIKESDTVPNHIFSLLASDVELMVAAPVLEYSPLLEEDDLLEILAATQLDGVAAAVARRGLVGGRLADAVVETGDVPAVAALLANENAQIREETLDRLIEQAAEVEPWHAPIVGRPSLPAGAIRKVAGFVAASLLRMLAERNDLDPDTVGYLEEKVAERLEEETEEREEFRSAAEQVAELHQEDKLDDQWMQDAVKSGQRAMALNALVLLSGFEMDIVHKIIGSGGGKPVTALAWRAGLSMRTALKLQTMLALVTGKNIVNARKGFDYPMTDSEMEWNLEFFPS